MTIAIPLIIDDHECIELRYCLRSIEKYLPGNEVVIIGTVLPWWINNVTQIAVPDIKGRKQLSIKNKIIAALEYSEEILFLNDDIYFTDTWTEFPYYYHGELNHYTEAGSKQLMLELKKLGKPSLHFDGHMPIMYDRRFIQATKTFSSDTIIKSMYCNYLGLKGEFIPDCKLHGVNKPDDIRRFIETRKCFSTGSTSLRSTLFILQELFPSPSKYEL